LRVDGGHDVWLLLFYTELTALPAAFLSHALSPCRCGQCSVAVFGNCVDHVETARATRSRSRTCRSRPARSSLFISRSVLNPCRPAREALAHAHTHTHSYTHASTWILRIVAASAERVRKELGYFAWLGSLNVRKAIHDPRRSRTISVRARTRVSDDSPMRWMTSR